MFTHLARPRHNTQEMESMSTPPPALTPTPIIINTAYTGAVSDKKRNPAVPYSIEEIHASATECARIGSTMGHFHVRTASGEATNDPALYSRLFAILRNDEATRDIVMVASTSGRHGQTIAQRSAVLLLEKDVRPDMASLTLSSLNFPSTASVNSPDDIRGLAETMLKQGVKPELEVFDLGMMAFAHKLIDEGLLEPPHYFNIILGNVAGAQTDLISVAALSSNLPPGSVVAFGGIGRAQSLAHTLALGYADGVRTGLEDNIRLPGPERRLATNTDLVHHIVDLAGRIGRLPSSSTELRRRLGLKTDQ
jgi:3-keto-5-aminohexanoate cleavage enzyme